MLPIQIAELAHEVNRIYCEANNDNSQLTWKDAPQWQKDSALNGVKFHLDNPNSKPEDSHNNWLKEKTANGWMWGEEKNVELKQHPCMVAYEDLPEFQKVKDKLFITIVKTCMNF